VKAVLEGNEANTKRLDRIEKRVQKLEPMKDDVAAIKTTLEAVNFVALNQQVADLQKRVEDLEAVSPTATVQSTIVAGYCPNAQNTAGLTPFLNPWCQHHNHTNPEVIPSKPHSPGNITIDSTSRIVFLMASRWSSVQYDKNHAYP